MEWLRRADELALGVIYPRGVGCVACGRPAHGSLLCRACAQALEDNRLTEPRCPVCGHSLPDVSGCAFCAGGPLEAWAPFAHEGVARRLVHRLKFQMTADAAIPLAEAMTAALAERSLTDVSAVTWVTTTPQHLRERGFDHARTLARLFAEKTGLQARPLLRRVRTGRLTRQLGANRDQRLIQLEGTFACNQRLGGLVLLIDDVMTTGSTARTASAALYAAGAERVVTITATQAP